ncbi:MAG: hypothetical protein CMF24_07775 [Ilumatobacter sp.]|nr:hypothetical protein [Ilumatobacter sp.]
MFRLRQVALVATDLDTVVSQLCETFDLSICFEDPGVAEFGLRNALMVIGDQFLEVVSPTEVGTTAGRLIEKRKGDGGYMVMYECDDLDDRIARITQHDVRVVWAGDFPTIRGRHLHPRDVGGALVSIDQPVPNGSWAWAGPSWEAHRNESVVAGIAGIAIGAADVAAMSSRWSELGIDRAVEFAGVGERGEGIDGVDLIAADRSRRGETHEICGVTFRLV